MKTLCKKVNKVFENFREQSLGWNSDSVGVCPYCGVSPYESAKYDLTHSKVKLNSSFEYEEIKVQSK